jgi:hypothetical protein
MAFSQQIIIELSFTPSCEPLATFFFCCPVECRYGATEAQGSTRTIPVSVRRPQIQALMSREPAQRLLPCPRAGVSASFVYNLFSRLLNVVPRVEEPRQVVPLPE